MAKQSLIDQQAIRKALDSALEATAKDIGHEIQNLYESCIDTFYADYQPHSYRRTLSLYKGSSAWRSSSMQCIPNGAFCYQAGIKVGPQYYLGNPYAKQHGWKTSNLANPEYIFPRSWEKGIHGFNRYSILKYNGNHFFQNPLLDSVIATMSAYTGNDMYDFLTSKYHVPPSMIHKKNTPIKNSRKGKKYALNVRTSPRAMMNQGFKKIKSKKHIDEVFNSYWGGL